MEEEAVIDGAARSLEAEHLHAEALLVRGEVDAAEDRAHRLLAYAGFLGRHHYRGAGHATLAKVERARQRHLLSLNETLEALRHLDHAHDPALFCLTVFALSRDLLAGEPVSARFGKLVREIRLRRTSRGCLPWPLYRWLEGRVLQSRGRVQRAAGVLSGARRRCLALGAPRAAVAIALDLADAYLAGGDGRTARVMVRDTLRAVEDLGLDAVPLGAFRDYAEALTAATAGNGNGDHGSGIELGAHADRVRGLLFG
ncbi:MAG: hypothetical protein V3T72_09545 [Thermoanaerobaculia bacterium]